MLDWLWYAKFYHINRFKISLIINTKRSIIKGRNLFHFRLLNHNLKKALKGTFLNKNYHQILSTALALLAKIWKKVSNILNKITIIVTLVIWLKAEGVVKFVHLLVMQTMTLYTVANGNFFVIATWICNAKLKKTK